MLRGVRRRVFLFVVLVQNRGLLFFHCFFFEDSAEDIIDIDTCLFQVLP
jgi:hypothetical protein